MKNALTKLGGHACSRLEAMAIYLVKQTHGNDILVSVYLGNEKTKSVCVQCSVQGPHRAAQPKKEESLTFWYGVVVMVAVR